MQIDGYIQALREDLVRMASLGDETTSRAAELLSVAIEASLARLSFDAVDLIYCVTLPVVLSVEQAVVEVGGLLAGEFVVAQMTSSRGYSNERAKKELGWEPRYASWREGFRDWVAG